MEFKVKPRKLKHSSQSISWSDRQLRLAKNKIDSAINNLDVGSSSYEIKTKLKSSSDKLSVLTVAARSASVNLGEISRQYSRTEAAINNMSRFSRDRSIFDRISRAITKTGDTISDIFHAGKNAYNRYVGDPVNLDNGNFVYEADDLEIEGSYEFVFSRFYNSLTTTEGAFGHGWRHSFEMDLKIEDHQLVITLEDGRKEIFISERGGFELVSGGSDLLVAENGGYRLIRNNIDCCFDGEGRFIRLQDENGIGFTLEYEEGCLSKVQKDSGEWFKLSYVKESPHRIERVTDHSGRIVQYTYKDGILETVVSGDRITAYEYDSSGHITGIIDPSGVKILRNKYDFKGRVIAQNYPDGSEMKYTYDDEDNVTVLTERNGDETYHYHDMMSRNTENVFGDGTETYDYDERGQVVYEKDRNDNETKYQYDNRGNITKATLADGTVINITYERHNKPATLSINGNRKQKNIYDEKGNLIESVDALGRRTCTKYNDRGLPYEIKTPGGALIEIEYDARDNICKMIDEDGVLYRYKYDELNRVVGIQKGTAGISTFTYDTHGNLLAATDPTGNQRSYTYNKKNDISEFVDYNGAITSIEYNSLGFIRKLTDPIGRVAEFEYDSMWNTSVAKLPNGGVRKAEYNSNNRLVKEIDATGNETEYEYDGNGNIIARIDPEGGITEFKYGRLNELIYVKDAEGKETHYRYSAEGYLTGVTQPNGGELQLEYDAAGQLIKEINSAGESRTYTYTPDGDVSSVTDEAGCETVMEYKSKGKLSKVSYPEGAEEFFSYDENGNIDTHSNNRGMVTKYKYDDLDRITEVKNNLGEIITYTYDEVGNLTSVTDAEGNVVKYEYSLTGQLTAVIDESGCRTEYDYDEMDALIGVRRFGNGEQHKTEYVRDLEGNVVKAIDPLGFAEEFVYNKRGELTKKTDKEGFLTEYGYDFNGNLISIRYDDGKEAVMKYDALDKLAEIRDWTGITKVESDIMGRVTKVIYPDERSTEYSYGKTGERTSIKYPDGRLVKYGYDSRLRLNSLKEGDTDIRYEYDDAGQLIGKEFSSGLAAKYAYNAGGQLTELQNFQSGKIIDSVKIKYNALGNRESVEKFREGLPEECGLFEYGYDSMSRLTEVRKDGKVLRHYDYDPFGNRSSITSTDGRIDYRYDEMDRLLEVSGVYNENFKYDRRGNIVERQSNGKVTHSYLYGAMDRLESARNTIEKVSYEYNGFGYRISEHIEGEGSNESIIKYTHDLTKYYKNTIEREINGDSDAYIWDGTLLAVKGRNNYNYANDDMGSPSRLMGMDGANAELYGYDEFGVNLHTSFNLQPFGYTGYMNDSVADMQYAQAREYMPEHGRFAAQDRIRGIGSITGTLNVYIYCGSMPHKYYDPDGFFWHIVAGATTGALVGGFSELGSQVWGQIKSGQGINLSTINYGKVAAAAAGGAVEYGMISAGVPKPLAAAAGGFVEGTGKSLAEGKSLGTSLKNGLADGVTSAAFAGIGEGLKKLKVGDKLGKKVRQIDLGKKIPDRMKNSGLVQKIKGFNNVHRNFYDDKLANFKRMDDLYNMRLRFLKSANFPGWATLGGTIWMGVKGNLGEKFLKKLNPWGQLKKRHSPSRLLKKMGKGALKCALAV